MDIEAMDESGQDATAVAAVRGGDAERYRELVERHERRVFAVAWSRLGDVELAGEATQEAFIKGYRRLWLLSDGAKFASWIASIARNTAINLGLRHRRELQKRKRWALEQSESGDSSSDDTESRYTTETLRETLLNLPATHRECLVLFYLEGKSGAEAALVLGISESAFRVRLHRAKAALRDQLEENLAGSLEGLRPPQSLVPAIMIGVLASSSAQAATAGGAVGMSVGTKLLATMGKSTLFSWLLPFIWLIGIFPGMVFTWWWGKLERKNFRDKDGFRGRLHQHFTQGFFWGFPLLVLLFILFIWGSNVMWGMTVSQWLLVGLMLIPLFRGFRTLQINRNRFNLGNLLYSVILTSGIIAPLLGWLPPLFSFVPIVVANGIYIFFIKDRPRRVDYNLFLRASQKMLQFDASILSPVQPVLEDRKSLLAFARFLGERWLVVNYKWHSNGLQLELPSVKSNFIMNMFLLFVPMLRQPSTLVLAWDGTVRAKINESDLIALVSMGGQADLDCERQVSQTVTQSWQAFRDHDLSAAAKMLGELPDSELFHVAPEKAKSTRFMQVWMGASVSLMVVLLLFINFHPRKYGGLKSVSLSENQIRSAVNEFGRNTPTGNLLSNRLTFTLSMSYVLPGREYFTEASLKSVQQEILKTSALVDNDNLNSRLSRLENNWALQQAIVCGWVTLDELGLNAGQVSQHLRREESTFKKYFLMQRAVGGNGNLPAEGLGSPQMGQLRLLKQLNCLGILEREKLIHKLVSWQVTGSEAYADRPPLPDWRQARGLFATAGWPALQDTYCVVAALEMLGGLEKIDREACIEGVLRLHLGEGLFQAKQSYQNAKLQIVGDARDTFCAFETLRILDGLDRVKDLERWQFRVNPISTPAEVDWNEIEAWVCQQRFAQSMRERRNDPKAPIRSLLDP